MKLTEYVRGYPRTFNRHTYPLTKDTVKWNELKGRRFIEEWDKQFNLKPVIV